MLFTPESTSWLRRVERLSVICSSPGGCLVVQPGFYVALIDAVLLYFFTVFGQLAGGNLNLVPMLDETVAVSGCENGNLVVLVLASSVDLGAI